ncbi:MAG: NTPase [Candidatus Thermoplasmatota archaeon]|nr:NTPase [Candidatus Thermoplasmatota archaeon]
MERSGNIFITGPPRSGKSTLVKKVLKDTDLKVEGLRTPDIREDGDRKGFKLVDMETGEEGILAHVDLERGPKVSRYRVDLKDLEKFTKKSLRDHPDGCDLIVIDEIGTMELFSDEFEEAVKDLLNEDIPVLAVLHRNQVEEYERSGEVYDLNERDYEKVKNKIKESLKKLDR